MATQIRRSLFIGLGGTGMSSLLYTKKAFYDTYGEKPPMIGFLGMDTDKGYYARCLQARDGSQIRLEPNEQLPICVDVEPKPIYQKNIAKFSWIPQNNLLYLKNMKDGAGQIRSNGRFALTYNEKLVSDKLKDIVNDICNAKIATNPKYDILSDDVEIHMVFSVCGGTGAGTFLSTAYLVKEVLPQCKLFGYAVLPDVFESMMRGSAVAHVTSNAYGAIKDLDFLMHLDMGKEPVKLEYLNRVINVDNAPFDAVYLIDNKNDNGDVYSKVENLTEMISLAFITSTGALSGSVKGIGDNLMTKMRDGGMNVKDKLGWISGFGTCEMVYMGDELKHIYALKSAQKLITLMTNDNGTSNDEANAWIDNAKIRENNGKDDVIDYILQKQAKIPYSAVNTPSNAAPEIDAYLSNMALPSQKDIDGKVDALKERVAGELDKFVKASVNKEGGVGTTQLVLKSIGNQIGICLKEMKEESAELLSQQGKIIAAKDSAVTDLTHHMSKFIHRNDQQYMDVVITTVNALATNKRELARRQAAITFYTWLQTALNEKANIVLNIRKQLESIKEECLNEVDAIQLRVGKNPQVFSIDLAAHEVSKVTPKDNEIVFSDFIGLLNMPNKVYDFYALQSNDVKSMLMQYCDNLKGAKEYADKSVDSVLRSMEPIQRNQVIKNAIMKSSPLISYDYRGEIPEVSPEEFFYIGVADANESVLVEDNLFKGLCQGAMDVAFSSIGMKDRILIYRQIGVMPAFAVKAVPTYEIKYDSDTANNHFDANICRRMEEEEYSLYPKDEAGKALELWVKGLIFGLIKNEGGKYYFKSTTLGKALDDYWLPLNNWRDESYKMFSEKTKTIEKDYDKFFDELQARKGTAEIQKVVADAKLNYYETYSQINLDKVTLKKKGYENVANLIEQEMDFVYKKL